MSRDLICASADLAHAADALLRATPLEMGEAARQLSDCLAIWRAASAEHTDKPAAAALPAVASS